MDVKKLIEFTKTYKKALELTIEISERMNVLNAYYGNLVTYMIELGAAFNDDNLSDDKDSSKNKRKTVTDEGCEDKDVDKSSLKIEKNAEATATQQKTNNDDDDDDDNDDENEGKSIFDEKTLLENEELHFPINNQYYEDHDDDIEIIETSTVKQNTHEDFFEKILSRGVISFKDKLIKMPKVENDESSKTGEETPTLSSINKRDTVSLRNEKDKPPSPPSSPPPSPSTPPPPPQSTPPSPPPPPPPSPSDENINTDMMENDTSSRDSAYSAATYVDVDDDNINDNDGDIPTATVRRTLIAPRKRPSRRPHTDMSDEEVDTILRMSIRHFSRTGAFWNMKQSIPRRTAKSCIKRAIKSLKVATVDELCALGCTRSEALLIKDKVKTVYS